MTNERKTVRPKGVQATVADSGQIILEFDHEEIPAIELSSKGAVQVGTYVQSAASRVTAPNGGNGE